jgi:hypothetical protein
LRSLPICEPPSPHPPRRRTEKRTDGRGTGTGKQAVRAISSP